MLSWVFISTRDCCFPARTKKYRYTQIKSGYLTIMDWSKVWTAVIASIITASILGIYAWVSGTIGKVPQILVPSNAVVAFNIEDGCPDGWSRFRSADGRVIIGTNERFSFFEEGGHFEQTLGVANIPPHSHPVHGTNHELTPMQPQDSSPGEYGRYIEHSTQTGNTGEGRAFSIMPPYIPLTYCIRD